MTKSVFNKNRVDFTQQYMFFGEQPNVNRNDVMKFTKFDDFTEQQHGFFWRPSEIDCTKDRVDFMNMDEHEKHVFLSNIKYQTMLDSVQGRAPTLVLGQIVSLPELETWLTTWAFSETIHSRSYTHLLRNVLQDPTPVFDEVMDIPEIMDRAARITEVYDDLYNHIMQPNFDVHQAKILLFKCVVVIYSLEAIRFYASFVSTFSFAKRGVMEGQGKIMELIARDEHLHQGSTHFMITRWLLGLDDPEMTEIARNHTWFIKETMQEVCEQEMVWADYLFQYGAILGLNATTLKQYLKWLTDERTKQLLVVTRNGKTHDFGYERLYDVKTNPIPWVDQFLRSDNVQITPQETEISTYLVGNVKADVDDDFLSELSI